MSLVWLQGLHSVASYYSHQLDYKMHLNYKMLLSGFFTL
jgi:hypothetical protein